MTGFATFYRSLHGRAPYLWQERAAQELAEGAAWDTLTAPTGAGKTTLLDAYLYALAASDRPAVPRRLFWVVDRRSVIDQVFTYAQTIADTLRDSTVPAVIAVRERIAALGGGEPLQVRLWRGALTDQDEEHGPHAALNPAVCAIVCSTVDQVGSRMLFRGYGVSRRTRPVAAAVCATDCLIVLDEAHLSGPFLDTARAVGAVQRAYRIAGPRVVASTATPYGDKTGSGRFELTAAELAEPLIARRVEAPKPVTLALGREEPTVVREARRLARPGQVVGVIVNTVALARRVHTALADSGDALLLIGPSRPLDRAGILGRVPDRAERGLRDRPCFVVGTQTLEVGVDLDFDALVCACAPFTALVQRFGRLDRAGVGGNTHGVIVAPPKRCPIYGPATDETWQWLQQRAEAHGGLDLSPRQVARLADQRPPEPPTPPRAPLLKEWHVEALAQTSHEPTAAPDPAVFLHGETTPGADVQLFWRADLTDPNLTEDESTTNRVLLRPPHPGELLSLPISAARRWLRGEPPVGFGDIESEPEDADAPGDAPSALALRVGSPDPDGLVRPNLLRDAADLTPGDVLALPAARGGCDEFGWAPDSALPVTDLGNLAGALSGVLIAPTVGAPDALVTHARDVAAQLADDDLRPGEAYTFLAAEVRSWMEGGGGHPDGTPAAAAARRSARTFPQAGHGVSVGADLVLLAHPPRTGARKGRQVTYAEHVAAVEQRAVRLAETVLDDDAHLIHAVRLAARYHDAGKLDPRFQAWLNDGAPGDPDRPLAKSGRAPNDPVARRARHAAGWPPGKRHEQASVAALRAAAGTLPAEGRDLILHLVATHHGDARPFRYAAPDPTPTPIAVAIEGTPVVVNSSTVEPCHEHAERWIDLHLQYGPWGLALLEALLVMADRETSAAEAA